MKATLLFAVALLLAPAGTEIHFAPEAGSSVEKSFTSDLKLKLESMELTFTVEGEEHEMEEDEVPDVSLHSKSSYSFRDEYVATDAGRPKKLKRKFGTLESTITNRTVEDGETEETESEKTSQLSGATVAFTWDDEAEAYELAFVDLSEAEERDAGLLEGLKVEADYTMLLPEEDVEVKDSWEVAASAFYWISSPSGDLHLLEEDENPDDQDDFEEQFRDHMEGAMHCTLAKVEDGIATIALKGEFTSNVHLVVDTDAVEAEEESMGEVEVTRDMAFEYELEGALLWDLKAGRAVSLSVQGPLELTIEMHQTSERFNVHQVQVMRGTYKEAGSFE